MAKTRNVDLTGVLGTSEGPEIDLTDVDTNKPLTTTALDALREKAEPKTTRAPRKPRAPKTDATAVAQSLDTEALGTAYEETSARLARKSRPISTAERPLLNLRGEVVEGLSPEEREEKDETPTNVPRTFGREGFYRNQIHGDYSHFAKLTNLADFLSRKTEEAQDALNGHPAAAKFDDIHRMLSVAFGHITDAQNAHLKGETGLTRRNPETGRAEVIGKQFLRSGVEDPFGRKGRVRGSEDPYGSQAITRGIGFNPVSKINAEIGEPQLKSEGISTNVAEDVPFGAVPHFHRAAQLIATASNLLQGSIADVSSDRTIGANVKPWNGRYDWRAGDPDVVNHADKLSSDYAESVARGATDTLEEHDDMTEKSPAQVQELFDRTKRAMESEIKAKEQQANIHAGLVKGAYLRFFGKVLAARTAAAAEKTAKIRTLPVVPAPRYVPPFDASRAPGNKNPLEWSVEKKATASNVDLAKETSKTSLDSARGAVALLPTLLGHAKDALSSKKISQKEYEQLYSTAQQAVGHHNDAVDVSSTTAEKEKNNFGIVEPKYTYDPAKDPRIKRTTSQQIAYSKMTEEQRIEERNAFLETRGQSLADWQKEVKRFEEKQPVISATDASLKADYIAQSVGAEIAHHKTIADHAMKAYNAVDEIHKKLQSVGAITSEQVPEVKPDLTGIPSLDTFARASRPGRIATRREALDLMKQENEKAQAEAARKAQEEADKAARLSAEREERSRKPATQEAREFGFYTEDEETAKAFLDSSADVRGDKAQGDRRVEFLQGLAAKGAVEFTATPREQTPGKALFIAPGQPSLEEVRTSSMSPKRAKRAARAASRVAGQAREFGRRKLAEQVSKLGVGGLDLEEALRVDVPETPRNVETPADTERKENEAIIEGLKRSEASPANIDLARKNLAAINEFNAASEVGTTIKPTRRTRK